MFWDCFRCGYGTCFKIVPKPWECPICKSLTDDQAQYVLDLHTDTVRNHWKAGMFDQIVDDLVEQGKEIQDRSTRLQ